MPYADPNQLRAYKRAWYLKNRERTLSESREKYARNPEPFQQAHKLWREKNPERARQLVKRWQLKNRERRTKTQRAWREKNRQRADAVQRAYQNRRYRVDPNFRLLSICRARLWAALKGKTKSARTLELLGCTIPELRTYLETLFRPGMTWENQGDFWQIDHKRPCASFDLTDPAQQRECFNYKNLQPLFSNENRKKGADYAGSL